jgi:hypothetical protein
MAGGTAFQQMYPWASGEMKPQQQYENLYASVV